MSNLVVVHEIGQQVKTCGELAKRELARDGEFKAVAMPHTKSLLRAASRLTGQRSSAEDLVQETLLRAWRSFDRFKPETNCKAWLFKIMLNYWSSCRRPLHREPQAISFEEHAHSDAKIFSPIQFTATEILEALDAISEDHRAVLMLAVVEGFTCGEIAQILGIPIGTVLSRISRAKAALRARLGGT